MKYYKKTHIIIVLYCVIFVLILIMYILLFSESVSEFINNSTVITNIMGVIIGSLFAMYTSYIMTNRFPKKYVLFICTIRDKEIATNLRKGLERDLNRISKSKFKILEINDKTNMYIIDKYIKMSNIAVALVSSEFVNNKICMYMYKKMEKNSLNIYNIAYSKSINLSIVNTKNNYYINKTNLYRELRSLGLTIVKEQSDRRLSYFYIPIVKRVMAEKKNRCEISNIGRTKPISPKITSYKEGTLKRLKSKNGIVQNSITKTQGKSNL